MRIPVYNVIQADSTDAEKPGDDYGCKQESNPVSAKMLEGKQAYKYNACNRNFNICHAKEGSCQAQISIKSIIYKA